MMGMKTEHSDRKGRDFMFMSKLRHLVVSVSIAAGLMTTVGSAGAAPAWVRNLTIIGVAETDGTVQVNIVQSGAMQWVSVASSSSGATRFLSAMTAAWLAGKKIDVKVDTAATPGCGTSNTNCENVIGWYIHN
jgi:hypothetical protein